MVGRPTQQTSRRWPSPGTPTSPRCRSATAACGAWTCTSPGLWRSVASLRRGLRAAPGAARRGADPGAGARGHPSPGASARQPVLGPAEGRRMTAPRASATLGGEADRGRVLARVLGRSSRRSGRRCRPRRSRSALSPRPAPRRTRAVRQGRTHRRGVLVGGRWQSGCMSATTTTADVVHHLIRLGDLLPFCGRCRAGTRPPGTGTRATTATCSSKPSASACPGASRACRPRPWAAGPADPRGDRRRGVISPRAGGCDGFVTGVTKVRGALARVTEATLRVGEG